MSFYLGIDIGTTAIKGIVISSTGEICATHYVRRSEISRMELHPDDPANVWSNFKIVIQSLRASAPEVFANVSAIAISGVVPNICLLNARDEVHSPLLRYSDRRAYNIEVELDSARKSSAWQNEVLSKLIWLKANSILPQKEPLKIFSPHTWITYKLTGKYVMDRVSAIEHGCVFDISNQCWDEGLLRSYSVDYIEWPDVTSPFAVSGRIDEGIARELGLSDSVKVAVGGPDFLASLLGSGAREAGDTMIYLGTYHCGCELAYSLADIDNGNLERHAIKWISTIPQVGPQCEIAAELITGLAGNAAWSQLELLAMSEPTSGNGTMFVPCVQLLESTISTKPLSGLFFTGSRLEKSGLARAVFESTAIGIAVDLKRHQVSLKGKRVYISGGGCRSRVQRETLSTVLQIPVTFIAAAEDGLGSALIAMRALDPVRFLTLDIEDVWKPLVVLPKQSTDSLVLKEAFYEGVIRSKLDDL